MSAENESTNVLHLMEMLQYQEGSIVSRVLLKKPGGNNITLFAFAAESGLSEHSSPHDAFVQVLEGEVLVHVGGEPYALKGGDAIVLPGNVPHALSAITPFKMVLTMFSQ